MALSTTYYCDNDLTFANVTTTANVCKSFLQRIKELMIGSASGVTGPNGPPPVESRWTLVASSDSVTAGASDLLPDFSKWVRAAAGVAHSWAVFRSPAALGSWEICLDYASAADADFILVVAKTAFTGGTILARPTSTDEVPSLVAQTKVGVTTALAVHKISRVTDASGNFHIKHTTTGSAVGFPGLLAVQQLANQRTGDNYGVAAIYEFLSTGRGAGGSVSTGPLYSFSTSTAGGVFLRSPDGVAGAPDTASGSGVIVPPSNYLSAASANNADGKADGFPCLIWTRHSAGVRVGMRGTLPDWYITNVQNGVGTVAPAAGTPEHQLVGNLWLPTGGLAAVL